MLLGHQSERLKIGRWRTHQEPMQIVSGPIGKIKIHFEAPPSDRVPTEMNRFFLWFNHSAPKKANEIKTPAIRSAIAHLYFESIHPFEDGNGRIGRAISEKTLAQCYGHPVLLSLSKTIEKNKKSYYGELKNAQKSNDISEWLQYFTQVVLDAQCESEKQFAFILKKSKFFDQFSALLNERQLKVIKRILESREGFEGGMSAKKYMGITCTSKATATRDLQYLTEINALQKQNAGRSTRYFPVI